MKLNSAIAAALLATGVYADDASKVDSTESSSTAAVEVPTFTVSIPCLLSPATIGLASFAKMR